MQRSVCTFSTHFQLGISIRFAAVIPQSIEGEAKAEVEEAPPVEEVKNEEEKEKEKYPTKRQPDHNSMFLAMRDQQVADEELKKKKEHDLKTRFITNEVSDPLHGNRVHCWVMVLAGKRDVQEVMQ